MAGTLDEIAVYLAASGHGTVGVDIFAGLLPDAPDGCIALFESPGRQPVLTLSGAVPIVENPDLQVRVRATTYSAARVTSRSVWTLLAAINDTTLSSVRYLTLLPVGSPSFLLRDQSRRTQFYANFSVVKGAS